MYPRSSKPTQILLSLILLIVITSLAACSGAGPIQDDSQKSPSEKPGEIINVLPIIEKGKRELPEDAGKTPGSVYIDLSEIREVDGQYFLYLSGTLPTPCHQLRWTVSDPDVEHRYQVEVYSVSDPNEICIQVLEPFEVLIPLDGFVPGQSNIYLNGELILEFE